MKKNIILVFLLFSSLLLTGCTEEIEELSDELDDVQYAYPDTKDVIVSLDEYNQLEAGMTEDEVWNIIGGVCTNTGTTDLGIGSEYVTVSYGCNGNGEIGSNVVLMFQGGELSTFSQIGLK